MREQYLEARSTLVNNLHEELIGPGSGEFLDAAGSPCSIPNKECEVITDLPERRYYIGVLYPQRNQMKQSVVETLATSRQLGTELSYFTFRMFCVQ